MLPDFCKYSNVLVLKMIRRWKTIDHEPCCSSVVLFFDSRAKCGARQPRMSNGSRTSSIDSSTVGSRTGHAGSCWPSRSHLACRSRLVTHILEGRRLRLSLFRRKLSYVAAVFVYHPAGARHQSSKWRTQNPRDVHRFRLKPGFENSSVSPPDLPPPPVPPPAVLKSPTHPAKVGLECRGVISPKAVEGRDKKGGGGAYRPREGSDHRTSSSERKDTQEKQRTTLGGKGNKHEAGGAIKIRQHAGDGSTQNNAFVTRSTVSPPNICNCP